MQKNRIIWTLCAMSFLIATPCSPAESNGAGSLDAPSSLQGDGDGQRQRITPGTTIGAQNWEVAAPFLPAEVISLLRTGDFTLTVQETTDLPNRPSYLEATVAKSHAVQLGEGSHLEHYQGGRPFPLLTAADPQAGEKAIWNFRYRDVPAMLTLRGRLRGVSATGAIDRANTGRFRMRYGMYRNSPEEDDSEWQAEGIHSKVSIESIAPADFEGNVQILTLYDDDARPYEEIDFNPQDRRIRKGYVNQVARFAGGRYDFLVEEQPPLFFMGYLQDYTWRYRGERELLVPGFLRADHVIYGGRNNWYPNVPWEVRRVVEVEVLPKGEHPYSKRVMYLDAQTYALLGLLSYDQQGTFVRLSLMVYGNPDYVPGAQGLRVPVPLGATWISFVQAHASQFIAERPLLQDASSARRFDVMELFRKGK